MTTYRFDKSLLKEPDAVLFKPENAKEIHDFLSYYTVPMFFFQGTPDERTYLTNGSGSLLRLGGRFFVISAGHVIKRLAGNVCLIPPSKSQSRFIPKLDKYRYHDANGIDYGYAEIPAADAGNFTANDTLFMGPERIFVASYDELKSADDWMIIAGFPDDLMTVEDGDRRQGRGVRLLHLSTTIADVASAPKSNLVPPPSGMHVIDLWAAEAGLETMSGNPEMRQIPKLGGASGGGCWKANVRPDPNSWHRDRLKLSAVHIGSTQDLVAVNGMQVRFSREVLIGHHLRMIADDYPELREDMYRSWPILRQPDWATKP